MKNEDYCYSHLFGPVQRVFIDNIQVEPSRLDPDRKPPVYLSLWQCPKCKCITMNAKVDDFKNVNWG